MYVSARIRRLKRPAYAGESETTLAPMNHWRNPKRSSSIIPFTSLRSGEVSEPSNILFFTVLLFFDTRFLNFFFLALPYSFVQLFLPLHRSKLLLASTSVDYQWFLKNEDFLRQSSHFLLSKTLLDPSLCLQEEINNSNLFLHRRFLPVFLW